MECIVDKRCVLEKKLLLTAYRKSHRPMRNRLVQKWNDLDLRLDVRSSADGKLCTHAYIFFCLCFTNKFITAVAGVQLLKVNLSSFERYMAQSGAQCRPMLFHIKSITFKTKDLLAPPLCILGLLESLANVSYRVELGTDRSKYQSHSMGT